MKRGSGLLIVALALTLPSCSYLGNRTRDFFEIFRLQGGFGRWLDLARLVDVDHAEVEVQVFGGGPRTRVLGLLVAESEIEVDRATGLRGFADVTVRFEAQVEIDRSV